MKLLFFDDFKLGILKADAVVDVSDAVKAIPHNAPHELINGLIARFAEYRRPLEEAAARGKGIPVAQVRIRPPVPKPYNIVAMAVNYMEDGTRAEPAPINAFHKSPSAVIGDGDTMVLPDVPATIFEGEAEVALVIGTRASRVSPAEAWGYVRWVTAANDFGVYDLRYADGGSNVRSKGIDGFTPLGPLLLDARAIDPATIHLRTWVNGLLVQDADADSDMFFSFADIVADISRLTTLEPGDIIAMGTALKASASGGAAVQNVNLTRLGGPIEVTISGIGTLSNPVETP